MYTYTAPSPHPHHTLPSTPPRTFTARSLFLSFRLQQQIKALGVAGVAAYGLFNTAYYTGAFLFCWLYVAKVPQGEQQGACPAPSTSPRLPCSLLSGLVHQKVPGYRVHATSTDAQQT